MTPPTIYLHYGNSSFITPDNMGEYMEDFMLDLTGCGCKEIDQATMVPIQSTRCGKAAEHIIVDPSSTPEQVLWIELCNSCYERLMGPLTPQDIEAHQTGATLLVDGVAVPPAES